MKFNVFVAVLLIGPVLILTVRLELDLNREHHTIFDVRHIFKFRILNSNRIVVDR